MDAEHLSKQKKTYEIKTQTETAGQLWSEELYREPREAFSSQTKGKQQKKQTSETRQLTDAATLLEGERMHAFSSDSEMSEKERRHLLYELAKQNINGRAAESITLKMTLEVHEDQIEKASKEQLIEETKEEIADFMEDPLLTREALKEMTVDEKLFQSQAAITELKGRVEKLKLNLLYMGGTEKEKSDILIPDQEEQALFLSKLRVARLLFSYRESRLAICSDKYCRDRELAHVMAATSKNGKQMKRLMEDSRQKYLRLLEGINHLPEEETVSDEIGEELEELMNESPVEETENRDPDEEELQKMLDEMEHEDERTAHKPKAPLVSPEKMQQDVDELQSWLDDMEREDTVTTEKKAEKKTEEETEDAALEAEFEKLEEEMPWDEEHAEALREMFTDETKEQQQTVVSQPVNDVPETMGKIDEVELRSVKSDDICLKEKEKLALDLEQEVTDNRELKDIFSVLKEYTDFRTTHADLMSVYKNAGRKEACEKVIEREQKLISDARVRLAKLLDDQDPGTSALARKYYDRLHQMCNGNLELKGDMQIVRILDDTVYGKNPSIFGKQYQITDQAAAPLFAHEPCLSDVVQGNLSDCALLSVLGTLVKDDPRQIKDMMYDHGDSVTIRLFRKDPKTKGYAPLYVNVPKVSTSLNNISALWVHLIELAYISSYIAVDDEKSLKDTDNDRAKYWEKRVSSMDQSRLPGQVSLVDKRELLSSKCIRLFNIPSGMAQDEARVMGVLTGKTAEKRDGVYDDPAYLENQAMNNMWLYYGVLKQLAGLTGNTQEDPDLAAAGEEEFIHFMADNIMTELLSIHLHKNSDLVEGESIMEFLAHFSRKITMEDIAAMMKAIPAIAKPLWDETADDAVLREHLKKYGLDEDVIKDLKQKLDQYQGDRSVMLQKLEKTMQSQVDAMLSQVENLLDVDHDTFGGPYTSRAEKAYGDIRDALEKGCLVTAGSFGFSKKDAPKGAAGEAMIDGIAAGHSYSVLGVTEDTDKNAKYIKLRNPWGMYSKEYVFEKDGHVQADVKEWESEDRNNGLIYVELNEFMNRFCILTFGGQ